MKSTVHLFLITESFPFGRGEKTFIMPELEQLKKEFHVTIISSASKEEANNMIYFTPCGTDVDIIHYDKGNIRGMEVVKYAFTMMLSKYGRKELWDILVLKDKIFSRIKKALFFWGESERFRRWLNRKKIINQNERVLLYSYWYDYHVLGMLINREKKWSQNVKILTRTHGCDLYDERIEKAYRQSFKKIMDEKIDRVIFASEYGYQYYLKKLQRAPNLKYHVSKIGAPAAESYIDCPKRKTDRMCIVSCSNVIPLKRLELIIEGLSLIDDILIKWIHFGTGKELEKIEEYAKLKLSKNITFNFVGHVSRENLYKYYSENYIDCFITVSESEGGCPVSIQEAMAFGIPIIGTSVGGISEMILGNGILLPQNPVPEQVSEAIRNIWNLDVSLTNQMRENSCNIWKRGYVDQDNAKRFAEYLIQWMENEE